MSTGYHKQPHLLRKTRKRIETLLSPLCDQFIARRNYAKSFDEYKTKILPKISIETVIQMTAKMLTNLNYAQNSLSVIKT